MYTANWPNTQCLERCDFHITVVKYSSYFDLNWYSFAASLTSRGISFQTETTLLLNKLRLVSVRDGCSSKFKYNNIIEVHDL